MTLSEQMAADAATADAPAPAAPQSLSQRMAADAAAAAEPAKTVPAVPPEQHGYVATFGAAAGHAVGSGALALQQLAGKGLSAAGGVTDVAPLQQAGQWLTQDADQGLARLNAQFAPFQAANPKTAMFGGLTGAVLSPINKLIPMGGSADSLVGAIGMGTASGAALSALTSPVDDAAGMPLSDFAAQKAKQAVYGAAGGAAGSAAGYGLAQALSGAVTSLRKTFSGGTPDPASVSATVNDTLNKIGVDPAQVPPGIFDGLKDQVAAAVKSGNPIDPRALRNLADAQTLPVPVPLTLGQITRDPMQFAKEQNLRGIQGVGEPITQVMQDQNRALIGNLNALGADGAPAMIDSGQRSINALQAYLDSLKAGVDQAYKGVRNMQGQSAAMDGAAFTKNANQALDAAGALGGFLPQPIANVMNDIATGKLPLSVEIAQRLDQAWGQEANRAGGGAGLAINIVRDNLRNATVSDSLGPEAMQAYQQAKALAAQRFQTIDANPALKALDSGSATPPDKFVDRYILHGNVSDVANLAGMIKQTDPAAAQDIKGSIVDWMKRQAIGTASDENGTFSQAAYNKIITDPLMQRRLSSFFAPQELSQLQQVGRVAENAIAVPKAAAVNTSNTASAAANVIKSEVESGSLSKLASLGGISPGLSSAARTAQGLLAAGRLRDLVTKAVEPSVGKDFVSPEAQAAVGRLSDLLRVTGARAGTAAASQ